MPPNFTIFWISTFSALIVAAIFAHPVYAVFAYLFEYYLRPGLHWWGKEHLPDLRWNLLASLVLASTYILHKSQLSEIGTYAKGPGRFLVALLAYMIVFTPFALSANATWSSIDQYYKLIIFQFLMVATVRAEWAFDTMVALHMAGAGWWGFEAWRNPRREGSRLYAVGSGDTWNDNFASAHLVTVMPFVVVYLLRHPNKKLRLLALIAGPFVINTLILCNSRGAMVGLAAAVLYAIATSKKGHRLRMLVGAVAIVGAFIMLADPEFIARQQTTVRYQEDGSAMGRLATWSAGVRLVKDYPFGAGGNGFEILSPVYAPEVVAAHNGELRAPHNTVILVASEWGIPGLILYFGYYIALFRLMWQVRKRAPDGGIWYYRAVAIELAMVAVFVAGLFSDRLYGEAPYWMGGFAVVTHRLQTHQLARQREAAGETLPERNPMALPPINLQPLPPRPATMSGTGTT